MTEESCVEELEVTELKVVRPGFTFFSGARAEAGRGTSTPRLRSTEEPHPEANGPPVS